MPNPTQTTRKIIILGAGIGGLTVAHELARCKKKNYDIHIYERHSTIGGMARSGFKERNGIKLPTEYCWRIYGPNYYNLREILKTIPLTNDSKKTVHDNIIDIHNYIIADQGTLLIMNNTPKTLWRIRHAFKKVPVKERLSVIRKIIYCFLISTKRLNSMDELTWKEYIDPDKSLSHDMHKYVIDIMAPYLGAEALQVNVPSVIKTLETFKIFNQPIGVMSAPTNEAWFDHWKSYLETQGVQFHLNTEVADIIPHENKIRSVLLSDGTHVTGDVFFCGLPVEIMARLPSLHIPGMNQLAQHGHQLMVGIQLYFDKKISLPHKDTALYIPDSPWQLVIEPQGSLWNKSYADIADFWSIGLCDPIRKGLLIKKPFIECSHEEILAEVWHQIKISELGKQIVPDHVKVLDSNVWNTYQFKQGKIDTYEPKFSTNQGTWNLRPKNQTSFENFYFSTAYTRTETDMFEMESAAESGRRAAHFLEKTVRVLPNKRPLFFEPYRWLDSIFEPFNFYKTYPLACFLLGLPLALLLIPFAYLPWRFESFS